MSATTTAISLAVPVITDNMSTLDATLAYAAAGFYIGPERRGTKDPGSILGDDWERKTSRHPQVITAWFAGTDHGIFLHMGRSGAVAIDVDDPDKVHPAIRQAVDQYGPPYQSTRSNHQGRGHYVFAMPESRRLGNGLGELGNGWGEIRGLNGVIIVAPSAHREEGGEYRWLRTGPVPVLPGYVASRLPDATEASEAATDAEVVAFLAKFGAPAEPRPDLLDIHVQGYRKKVHNGESRHNEITGPLANAMKEAAAGYLDAKHAADTFESVFLEVVAQQPISSKQGKPRKGAIAKNEWEGLMAWAVGQAQDADLDRTRARIREKFPPPYAEATYLSDQVPEDGDTVTDAQAAKRHRGQARMAYRLALRYGKRLLHVHGIGWQYWDGKRWAEDQTGVAKRAVLDVLRRALTDSFDNQTMSDDARKTLRNDLHKCESSSGINGVLSIAAALEPFAVTVDRLDEDPYLLNCVNGTLDLRTMELRPHNPADRITKITKAAFDPTAKSALWQQFLNRILPNQAVREFAQRYLGASLCGRVLEHKLAIFTGEGRNGKGALYGAVVNALGDYADAAEPDLFAHREGAHPTGEMDLRGLRFVVVSENDKNMRLGEAKVKKLTGGDKIKARRMRQDFVSFEPSHTPVLVTNFLPKVSGDDPALWARLRVVPFEVVIPEHEQDKHLGEKLELEDTAELTWLIQGWAKYRALGLAEPDEVRIATDKYQRDSNTLKRFVDECCLVGPYHHVAVAALWERWTTWIKEDGGEPLAKNQVMEALGKMGFPEGRGAKGVRSRKGLTLQAEEAEDA